MWLKALTSVMLLATVILLVTRPAIVGPAPHRPVARIEALHYSERALAFTVVLILTVSGAGVGSILLVRQAREEYRQMAMANMQALLEATLKEKAAQAAKSDAKLE